jgi:cytochrome P450
VQTKLREELLTVDTDNPTMDQLNALPYLDMVIRESLRVHPPVPATSRISMKDDILPLSKAVVDCKGKVHHTIRKVDFEMLQICLLSLRLFRSTE